ASLNGVAYTGDKFIAVGSGGVILTSTNASVWTPLASGTTGDLFGVAFAAGGPLQGVAVAVGANGTVLVGGELPAAPTSPVSQTNCADSLPNPALSVSVTDPNIVTVDWYEAATGGNQVATNTLSFTPTNTVAGTYTYFAQARDKRTEFINTNRTAATFTVNPLPTVNSVVNQGPYCNGASGAAIPFSGPIAGTTFSWTSSANVGFGTSGTGNIAAYTSANAGTAPVTATVTVTPTAKQCVGASITFTVTVNPTPAVNGVANQGPYCNGSSGAALPFSGPVAGTTFSWTSSANVGFGVSGTGNIAAYTAANAGTAPVTATVTVTPTAKGRVGPTAAFTVTVNPTPTVNSVANQGPYCNGASGAAINLTGPVAGTTFGWTSSANVGFGTSGTGNLAAYTAVNAGTNRKTTRLTCTHP